MRGRVHARRTLKGLVADLRQVRKYKELTATEKLKYRIAVKMTAADYFRLLTRSHEAGVSPSEYMRECFRNGHVKERLSEEHAGYIRQLCGMAKIVKGSDFKGAVDYIIDKKKDTQIVASEGLFMENLETIAMSFNAQSRMNDKVTKPVGHIALSFSKEDELRLTNRIMAGIALEYMERMGIKNTQFFIAQHFDKEHPHVHIAFNRIDNNGNTISDRHERLRSTRICKELTLKYGLHMAGGKDNVKRNRLKEPDRTKYALYDIIKMEVGRCGNWNVLIANLKRQGVEVHFKHKGQTSEVQGVVFSMNGYHFNGSKVDRRFSYSKIDAALQHNRCRERMGITAGIYETATPSAPSGTAQSELFNGSWGLLKSSGSSYNTADAEANQEMVDILRRRKKVKRKRGVGF